MEEIMQMIALCNTVIALFTLYSFKQEEKNKERKRTRKKQFVRNYKLLVNQALFKCKFLFFNFKIAMSHQP